MSIKMLSEIIIEKLKELKLYNLILNNNLQLKIKILFYFLQNINLK